VARAGEQAIAAAGGQSLPPARPHPSRDATHSRADERKPLVGCARVSEAQAFDISTRTEAPLHGDEVAVLRGMLTYQRNTLRWKCAGLTQQQLAMTLAPTDLTLGGLMKHLALVESHWFDHWFRDVGFAPPFDTMDWDTDWDIDSARHDSPRIGRSLRSRAPGVPASR
jgi:hypothetical protein